MAIQDANIDPASNAKAEMSQHIDGEQDEVNDHETSEDEESEDGSIYDSSEEERQVRKLLAGKIKFGPLGWPLLPDGKKHQEVGEEDECWWDYYEDCNCEHCQPIIADAVKWKEARDLKTLFEYNKAFLRGDMKISPGYGAIYDETKEIVPGLIDIHEYGMRSLSTIWKRFVI